MSPFSRYFHQLRRAYGIRQVELAELLGYEQSYISALENGTKGPPTPEFIERLAKGLALDAEQWAELQETVEASQRKLVIPNSVSEDVYWMIGELRRHLDTLHPSQIKAIREVLKIRVEITQNDFRTGFLPRRQKKEEIKM